jgi:hypothetical protein
MALNLPYSGLIQYRPHGADGIQERDSIMAGAQVILNVSRADNELFAFLNGVMVYDRKTENNPSLDDAVDLVPALKSGDNILVLGGINWGGPATFAGSLSINGFSTPFSVTLPSTEKGLIWHQVFNIPY